MINIYIANRVLHNHFDRGMAEDLLAIEAMFETNDFSGLDDIYRKYFIPEQPITPAESKKSTA